MERHMKRKQQQFIIVMLCIVLVATTVNVFWNNAPVVSAATQLKIPGKVIATNLNVRKSASRKAAQLVDGKTKVALKKNTAVTILAEKTVSGEKWYQVSFKLNGATKKGYVLSDYVQLTLKKTVPAAISSKTAVKIRTGAGDKKAYLKVSNKVVSLKKGTACTILKETTVSGKKWYQIQFLVSKKTYKGYILASQVAFQAEEEKKIGTVTASSLNVRQAAGTDKEILKYDGNNVRLTKGQTVTITGESKVEKVTWYKIAFTYQKKSLSGYASGEYIKIGSVEVTPTPKPTSSTQEPEETEKPVETQEPTETEEPVETEEPIETEKPTVSPKPTQTVQPTQTPIPTPVPTISPADQIPLTDAEFEAALTQEGFPEDYKPALRALHRQYPLWRFKANHIGLDWNTVIASESIVGKNLISNGKSVAWKSLEPGAYNWSTDKFVPYDSSTWVTASREAVEYYMDPRNFLTTDGIFQFELLSYNGAYQTVSGVESILKGTVLANTSYTYVDEYNTSNTSTYGETFIKAAEYSGVNPYHLATRVKQEVVTSSGLSNSASGNVSGYQGIYNFYNIGATHSTVAGGSILNALKFAKNGTGMSAANSSVCLIPWNNQYKAIVGGAKYIGNNYINRGQNTVYLQKFNLTATDRYNHQYMANVEAPKAEAQKTYNAYKNFTDIPVEFSIPVFQNMPYAPCPIPVGGANPNNWLKSLSVSNYTLSPTFQITNIEGMTYTVEVPSDVEQVTIQAQTVSTTATVSGTGTVSLQMGENTCLVTVESQAGTQRTYTIHIIRR